DIHKLGSAYQQPRVLYRNNGNETFTDISASAGPGITRATSGRGLAVGDLWNDGRLSAVITNMYDRPSLLVNQVRYPHHWVAIKTVGTRSNRDGIGARLTLKVGSRRLVDEVRSGSSYISQSDMRVHFGLGRATKIDYLEVQWPSGLRERFSEVPIDTIVTVEEGSGEALQDSPRERGLRERPGKP
ncbi:MAG: CRTAC1 family protein, partial [Acidobacteria bacterium]|nr:CRTAC1 family protein [Acidobacteriota bacterium]